MPHDAIVVFVTASSQDEAAQIGQALVERKLAACANIVSGVLSIYRWEGKITKDNECLMVVKTRPELFGQVQDLVRSLHSYAVPEIIAVPVIYGSPDYLGWITEETASS